MGNHSRSLTIWVWAGIASVIAFWWLVSLTQLEYLFPGPLPTLHALIRLLASSDFYGALGLTLGRALVGLFAAAIIGIGWGYAAGKYEWFSAYTRPLLQILMSIPPVVLVILAMVWFGSNGTVVVFVVTLVTTALFTTSTREAIRSMDRDLLEMATVFKLSKRRTFRHVISPMIAPPVLAAATVALGHSVRVSVMAELLATSTGIGASIRLAQINIETPDVFAYAITMATVTFVLEGVFVRPLSRRMQKHQEAVQQSSNAS
ncbi:MAG: ABC transporter permease subunit [Actinomycetaceae bacterium]|nr:ABC transporter permease subunit [Actinomycetaceae bacterium]